MSAAGIASGAASLTGRLGSRRASPLWRAEARYSYEYDDAKNMHPHREIAFPMTIKQHTSAYLTGKPWRACYSRYRLRRVAQLISVHPGGRGWAAWGHWSVAECRP